METDQIIKAMERLSWRPKPEKQEMLYVNDAATIANRLIVEAVQQERQRIFAALHTKFDGLPSEHVARSYGNHYAARIEAYRSLLTEVRQIVEGEDPHAE